MKHSKIEYSPAFYTLSHPNAANSAEVVVPLLLELIKVESVADVGCGDGTWLAAFQRAGVKSIAGFDGDYVRRDLLKIPADRFFPLDLEITNEMHEKFDLVLSLEVAEHLDPSAAENFVSFLTSLGDVICFSAAVPGQGGFNHVNEQWQDFWINEFAKHSYTKIDCLRPRIWSDDRVAWYYAQNIFVFVKTQSWLRYPKLHAEQIRGTPWPSRVVHPRGFSRHVFFLNERILLTEFACRILLVVPSAITLLVSGFPNIIPFQRLGVNDVRQVNFDPPVESPVSNNNWSIDELDCLIKEEHLPTYLAVIVTRCPTFQPPHLRAATLNLRYQPIHETPDLLIWNLSSRK